MNNTTLALILLASMTSAHAQLRVDADLPYPSTTAEEPSASKEPSANKESSTSERASAQEEQSANKNASNDKESSAKEDQSADRAASGDTEPSANKEYWANEEPSTKKEQPASNKDQQQDSGDEKSANSEQSEKNNKRDLKESTALIKDAAKRGTPPWTNDSANIHSQLSRSPADQEQAEPYKAEDFKIKPEWERWFASNQHFTTNDGEEVYEVLCQACHMPDGQGAQGAGHFPSFTGNERLRSPDYPAAVILNGLRGMPPFGNMLSDQQVAEVVNHLRTHFGNQLVGDMTAKDVARIRPKD